MEKSNKDLIEEFAEKYKDVFPDISLEEIKIIIAQPFNSFRTALKNNILSTFKIKFFGTFVIHEKRILSEYSRLAKRAEDNNSVKTQADYAEINKTIQEYIKSNSIGI